MIKLYESQIFNCQKVGEAVNAERETHNYGMKLRSTSTTENLNSSENNVEIFKSNIEETEFETKCNKSSLNAIPATSKSLVH